MWKWNSGKPRLAAPWRANSTLLTASHWRRPHSPSHPLCGGCLTSHAVILSGLASLTTYHFQAMSRDSYGFLGTSGDFTFTTTGNALSPLFQLHAEATEVSGVTNGSAIKPAVAPAGFTGTVAVNGTGPLNYAPAQSGNGVFFLNCCSNNNKAYYKSPYHSRRACELLVSALTQGNKILLFGNGGSAADA